LGGNKVTGCKHRVTVRIIGGLGNQLFSFAAARRLALANDADLLIDHLSGFQDDGFQRKYALHHFNIPQNMISENDPRVRSRPYRIMLKFVSGMLPFHLRPFLIENGNNFNRQLVRLRLRKDVYIQGYWQSEQYFKDVESQIREDLTIISTPTPGAVDIGHKVKSVESVAVHVRRLKITNPLPVTYYVNAIRYLIEHIKAPHYYIFSDSPGWAEKNLRMEAPVSYINIDTMDESGWMDLWLMSQCRHFIIANSTFSWWGAWLGNNSDKMILYPDFFDNWGHLGLIPNGWKPVRFG
jgi:hypothetical protein